MSAAMTAKDLLTAAIQGIIADLWDEHPSFDLRDKKKIEDAITPNFDDAYVAIATLEAQLEEARAGLREWIKENAPGGWIDDLRQSLAAKDAELNEVRQSLQAAIQRADEAEASCRLSFGQICTLQARVGKLEGAVKKSVSLLALKAVRFSDGVPVGPVGHAYDFLAAALASREGSEG